MMNGFQSAGRDISAHDSASTSGKKSANWTVGKSISQLRRIARSTNGPSVVANRRVR